MTYSQRCTSFQTKFLLPRAKQTGKIQGPTSFPHAYSLVLPSWKLGAPFCHLPRLHPKVILSTSYSHTSSPILSISSQLYLRNLPRTQPLTATMGLLGDHNNFPIGLLTQPLLSAQLGSWGGPCTRSSQIMPLRIKPILLLLADQNSRLFLWEPHSRSISCSFYSSHCGCLAVPQMH